MAWGRIATTTAALCAVLAPSASAQTVPALRTHGEAVVVCAPDSARRTRASWPPRSARPLLRLLAGCRHRRIQAALAAAGRGGRVTVLPGVYREHVVVAGRRVQLEGLGRRARDVVVAGGLRADRADGLVLAGLTVERGAVIAHTDGFRVHRVVVRGAAVDGLRAEDADHGLLDTVEAYGNGGAGLRLGPGARGDCDSGHGIEVRDANAYDNVVGVAASASAATWLHRSRLEGNATGVVIDSSADGPVTPDGCPRLEHLSVASNNADVYASGAALRPRLATPVGSGIVLRGVNGASVRDSAIYGNRRAGVQLEWAPAAARGQDDPARQFDSAHGNRFERNRMGVAAANGVDFAWDGEGARNCWSDNAGPGAAGPSSTRSPLPGCPAGSLLGLGDPTVHALEAPCAAWTPSRLPPPGCDWFALP